MGCSDDTGASGGGGSEESGSETVGGDGDGDSASGSESESDSMTTLGDGDGDSGPGDGDGDDPATATEGDGDGDTGPGDGDGDTGPGDGDGDTGPGDGDGDTGPGDGDGDTGGDGDGDTTGDGDGDENPPVLPAWILSIDEVDNTTDRLIRISIDDNDIGTVDVVCDDIELPDNIPATTNFTSLTFNQNVLFASAQDNLVGDTLMVIDPCTCTATEVGKYGYSQVNGITSNEVQDMFGVAVAEDVIIDIDPQDAQSVELAALGSNWGPTGLTWSQPQDNVLYGINATTDRLHTFDGDSGMEVDQLQLQGNFGSVGLELHPTFNRLFGCGVSGDGRSLYEVGVMDGSMTQLAPNVWTNNCDNIAAPFGPVDCIPM